MCVSFFLNITLKNKLNLFENKNKTKGPFFEELSGKYSTLSFIKVDVDELDGVAAKNDVSAMPTFMVFKDGKKTEELIGANKEKLEELIKKYA